MSVATEIQRIKDNISNTYTALGEKGATLPEVQNSANLADTVATVTTGGGGGEIRGWWVVPPSFTQLDQAMTNDSRLTELRDEYTTFDGDKGHLISVGIAFDSKTNPDTIFWDDDKIKGIYTSDGVFYKKESGVTIEHTWNTKDDNVDGYRWFIVYFEGLIYYNQWLACIDYADDSVPIYGTFKGITDTYLKAIPYRTSYLVVNGVWTNNKTPFEKALDRDRSSELLSFRTIGDGYVIKVTPMSSSYSKLMYYPEVNSEFLNFQPNESLGYSTMAFEWQYASAFPNGLDLTHCTDTSFSVVASKTMRTSTIKSMKIKLPPCNVTIYDGSNRFHILSKDNWEYMADNAPNVSSKTLTIGAINKAICGGDDSEIIQKFVSKGWTVA